MSFAQCDESPTDAIGHGVTGGAAEFGVDGGAGHDAEVQEPAALLTLTDRGYAHDRQRLARYGFGQGVLCCFNCG